MISIVTVFNKKEILENLLLKSLQKQSVDYQVIPVDNTKGEFTSAAMALNYGGEKAKGDYIMFVHQDVELLDERWLEKVEKTLESLPNVGVVGVAGRKNFGDFFCSVYHGPLRMPPCSHFIDKVIEVQTVDECLMIVPREIFEKVKFDERCCWGWHLYGVDYSLEMLRHGYKVYLIPNPVYHLSPGSSFSDEYYQILKGLIKKYKNDFKFIYTTMGVWNTFMPVGFQRYFNDKIYFKFRINKVLDIIFNGF